LILQATRNENNVSCGLQSAKYGYNCSNCFDKQKNIWKKLFVWKDVLP